MCLSMLTFMLKYMMMSMSSHKEYTDMSNIHVLPHIQDKEQISRILINMRHDSKMTCEEMTKRLNVSSNTLNRYFKASVSIRQVNYDKIIELYKQIYNVDVEIQKANVLDQHDTKRVSDRITHLIDELKQLSGCSEVLLKY